MLEIIAKTGLFINQPSTMAGMMVIGYFLLDDKTYAKAMMLLLFTMVYNVFLKHQFQIPLPAHMSGWAFPSGHMHSAFVFWGFLACEYKSPIIRALLGFMLTLSGYGLIYSIYHYPVDILGAVGFGTVSIILYRMLNRLEWFAHNPARLGLLLLPIAIGLFVFIPSPGQKLHLFKALGGLLGFTVSGLACYQPFAFSAKQKVTSALIFIAGLIALYPLTLLPFAKPTTALIHFTAIGLWIPLAKPVTALAFRLFYQSFRRENKYAIS